MISYAVMHTPGQRLEWLKAILAEFPGAVVVSGGGIWDTARLAWREASLNGKASHVMVLQDDMLPFPGAHERLLDAIDTFPDAAISGFQPIGPASSYQYHLGERAFFPGSGLVWGGSVVLPVEHARVWTDWADQANLDCPEYADDTKLSEYLSRHSVPTYHLWPTLFDNVGWDQSLNNAAPHPWRRGLGAKHPAIATLGVSHGVSLR